MTARMKCSGWCAAWWIRQGSATEFGDYTDS